MQSFVLEMNGISKSFPGVKCLDSVTLKIRPGTVHALMGENGAGKSTLMKCLFGIYEADHGEIILHGKKVAFHHPRQAMDAGISMVHQELHPVLDRSVSENVWLGRFPTRGVGPIRWVSDAAMHEATQKLFDELGVPVDPKVLIRTLSVSKIQMIEIAKAVSYDARVIVMDEPTSSLNAQEVERLFEIIADLKKRGVSVIYISHKMEEILRIADDVTILRDGCLVGTWPASELTIDSIITRMVGRTLGQRFPEKTPAPTAPFFRVEGLHSQPRGRIKEISFDIKKGEILGIGGLVGSQRTELVETIFGLRPKSTGRFFIDDKEITIRSPQDAIREGLALLTEERRATGIFPSWSVLENTVSANQKRYRGIGGLLNDEARLSDTQAVIKDMRVKTPSPHAIMKNLSGGNQQKVLLGRWLLTQPRLLILDEPTRGIDVGAKAEIYAMIQDLAKQGKSILLISSEMTELIGLSHRIMVLCEGRVAGFLGADASEEQVLRLATKFE